MDIKEIRTDEPISVLSNICLPQKDIKRKNNVVILL